MIKTVHIVPILKDNYCYVLEGDNKQCLIVDPGQTKQVEAMIGLHGLEPVAIINTHHHADHVAGNHDLKTLYSIPVYGPKSEISKIPHIDFGLEDGDVFNMASISLKTIETPGHTIGHICFYSEQDSILLAGDTLFSMGCGRLMEGSADDMWSSLQRLKQLPDETQIYCGHEYTESNGAFAAHVLPENIEITKRLTEVKKYRMNGMASLPVSLATEKMTNPFLIARDVQEFANLRQMKDNF